MQRSMQAYPALSCHYRYPGPMRAHASSFLVAERVCFALGCITLTRAGQQSVADAGTPAALVAAMQAHSTRRSPGWGVLRLVTLLSFLRACKRLSSLSLFRWSWRQSWPTQQTLLLLSLHAVL